MIENENTKTGHNGSWGPLLLCVYVPVPGQRAVLLLIMSFILYT